MVCVPKGDALVGHNYHTAAVWRHGRLWAIDDNVRVGWGPRPLGISHTFGQEAKDAKTRNTRHPRGSTPGVDTLYVELLNVSDERRAVPALAWDTAPTAGRDDDAHLDSTVDLLREVVHDDVAHQLAVETVTPILAGRSETEEGVVGGKGEDEVDESWITVGVERRRGYCKSSGDSSRASRWEGGVV
jgi:hypothetical protein